MPTAKVYVWKDDAEGDPKPWKVGSLNTAEIVIIHQEFVTHAEAWEWLYQNYKRDVA